MNGMVSKVYLDNGIIKKVYLPDEGRYLHRNIKQHWEREVKALKLLNGKKHFPQVIKYGNRILWMSYCGELLTKDNLPKDWERQCKEIENLCNEKKIYHIDLTEIIKEKKRHKNLCVNKGVIYVIDWGIWTASRKQYIEKKETVSDMIKKINK